MNSNQIFEMAFDLEKPWQVSKINRIKPSDGIQVQIGILLDFLVSRRAKSMTLWKGLGLILIFFSIPVFCMPV